MALRAGSVALAKPIDGRYLVTTPGRVLFNDVVPPALGFINDTMDKKRLENLVGDCYRRLGSEVTSDLLDALKDLGFAYATQAGFTVGIDDVRIPPEKDEIIATARKDVDLINGNYRNGVITESERYNKVINTWTLTTTEVEQVTFDGLSSDREGFNPIFMMADSGSRGNREQMRQLAGMRGLMAKPQKKLTGGLGEIIESPVIHNFKEGLTVLEYFISTHGARKGLADTALKTADAGYLTRRLVDVAQDVIINEPDCGTIRGLVGRRAQGRRGHHRAARRPRARPRRGGGRHPPDHRRRAGRGRAGHRRDPHARDRRGRQGGPRQDQDPLGADLRRAARRVRQVLRAQPGHRPSRWTSARPSASSPRSPSASRARSSRCGPSTSAAWPAASSRSRAPRPRRPGTVRYVTEAGSDSRSWTTSPACASRSRATARSSCSTRPGACASATTCPTAPTSSSATARRSRRTSCCSSGTSTTSRW